VEANFHFIRNSGGWHFRWDFAISLSARTGKAIVSIRMLVPGPVIRPEHHSKILRRRTKNLARP
jgi:hypothetical protein